MRGPIFGRIGRSVADDNHAADEATRTAHHLADRLFAIERGDEHGDGV
jgi:hypothetical protein